MTSRQVVALRCWWYEAWNQFEVAWLCGVWHAEFRNGVLYPEGLDGGLRRWQRPRRCSTWNFGLGLLGIAVVWMAASRNASFCFTVTVKATM